MIKATLPLGILLLLATPIFAQAPPGEDEAIREGVKRQADYITLHQKLEQARAAEARREYLTAANLYDATWELIVQIGPYIQVGPEAQEARAGLARVRLALAAQAQSHHRYREAKIHVDDVLRVDPQNQAAIEFRRGNDKLIVETAAETPSEEAERRVREIAESRGTNATRVQDAKMYYEMGDYDEAEALF